VTRKGRQARLGDEIERLVTRLDRKGGGALKGVRVAAAWKKVAGRMVETHSTGAHLRDATLVVYVDSPIWATELSAMAEHYREAVNTELGEELVRSVRFTVSRKVEEGRRDDPAPDPSRGSDETAEEPGGWGRKGL
jgi:predicted nucleic acid-binding Zn ribbon protein